MGQTINKGCGAILAGLLLAVSSPALAQNTAPADSVVNAFLPYVKFDSDIGFEGGISLNRYHYEEGVRPFNNLAEIRFRATTRGLFSTRLAWETVNMFDTGIRSRAEFIGERMLNDIYFPVGNNSEFNDSLWDEDYYFFDALGFELTYEGRYPLLDPGGDRRLDILFLSGGISRERFGDEEENIIEDFAPHGHQGGWYIYAGAGMLHDSRENEFDPRSGNLTRLEVTGSTGTVSAHSFMQVQLESSQFYSLPFIDNFTVAGRIMAGMVTSEAPFWMLPEVGGEFTVRGYPTGRFRDNGVLLTNLELRQWLMSFDFLSLKIGLTAFTDSGRVYSDFPRAGEVFTGFHRTIGGGPIFSAFTDDFIIRAQIGHSDEINRIYMNIGFSF